MPDLSWDCLKRLGYFPMSRVIMILGLKGPRVSMAVSCYRTVKASVQQQHKSNHPILLDLYGRASLERPPHWPQKCGLPRQVVSGNRFSYWYTNVLKCTCRSFCRKFMVKTIFYVRQVVSFGSGLSRQVSLYMSIHLDNLLLPMWR